MHLCEGCKKREECKLIPHNVLADVLECGVYDPMSVPPFIRQLVALYRDWEGCIIERCGECALNGHCDEWRMVMDNLEAIVGVE